MALQSRSSSKRAGSDRRRPDASFALHWCFEDEGTTETEELLTLLESQEVRAWVPAIWSYEILNALGKGIARGRMDSAGVRELPLYIVDIRVDQELLDLALEHNLAVYDASYLSLAIASGPAIATNDEKLASAANLRALRVIMP